MPRETAAQRKKREAEEAKVAEQAESVPTEDEDSPEPEQPQNIIYVFVEYGNGGTISVADVVASGDIRPTEIETLLTMAQQKWEKKAGLDRGGR